MTHESSLKHAYLHTTPPHHYPITGSEYTQISITTWLILLVCALFSLACLSIDNAIYQKHEPEAAVAVTEGGEETVHPVQNHPNVFSVNSVTEFNIAGWLLFLAICGFYMLARRSELRLLRKVMFIHLQLTVAHRDSSVADLS
jgi:hypothetical protein